jgi:hypothetical protein
MKQSPVSKNRPKQPVLDVTALVRRLDQQFKLGLESDCNSNNRQQLLINIALAVRLRPKALKLLNKEGPLGLKEVNRFLKRVGFQIQEVGGCYRLYSLPGLVLTLVIALILFFISL